MKTLIYSLEVSTIRPNYKLRNFIKYSKKEVFCKRCVGSFEISYKFYLTQNWKLSLGNPHPISMVADLCHFVFSLFRGDIMKAP